MVDAHTPLIRTDHLGRVFRARRRLFSSRGGSPKVALTDVTMHVEAGECVALVGPNGAGKSTLLRILATILTPSSGDAQIAGLNVERDTEAVRPLIGFATADHRSFFWPLSVMENLMFFGELQGMPRVDARRRACDLLKALHLDPDDNRPISDYSSGMQQRAALARSLLHDPTVLLLDEPTANLDQASTDLVVQLIERFRSGGEKAVLVATHDANLVSRAADRSLRVEDGTVTELVQGQIAVYRIRARGASARLMSGDSPDDACDDADVSFEVADLGDGHQLASAISRVVADGGEILSIETRNP